MLEVRIIALTRNHFGKPHRNIRMKTVVTTPVFSKKVREFTGICFYPCPVCVKQYPLFILFDTDRAWKERSACERVTYYERIINENPMKAIQL